MKFIDKTKHPLVQDRLRTGENNIYRKKPRERVIVIIAEAEKGPYPMFGGGVRRPGKSNRKDSEGKGAEWRI